MPRLLIAVGRRYVQHINQTYGRTGTLWDSRYTCSLVQADTYLRLCQHYIEFNPVRAGMVANPADYRWSSDRAKALGEPNGILTPHPFISPLSPTPASASVHGFAPHWRTRRSPTSDQDQRP